MYIKNLKYYAKFLFVSGLILFCSGSLSAQKHAGTPVSKVRLMKVVTSKTSSVPDIIDIIKEQGIDFKVTAAVEEEFLALKTRPQIIEAMRNNYRAPAAVAATTARTKSAPVNRGNGNKNVSQTSAQKTNDEKYEELYYKGLQLISQYQKAKSPQQVVGIANQIIEIGNQGIQLDKTRPEAYKIVGSGLIFNKQFEMAEKFGQEAINLGSSLAFPVYHLSGTPHPETLYVGKNYITVESNQKYFQYSSSEILEVSPQGFYNIPDGGSVAVLGIATMKDGQSDAWYFIPATSGTTQEAAMIIRLIKKNAYGGR